MSCPQVNITHVQTVCGASIIAYDLGQINTRKTSLSDFLCKRVRNRSFINHCVIKLQHKNNEQVQGLCEYNVHLMEIGIGILKSGFLHSIDAPPCSCPGTPTLQYILTKGVYLGPLSMLCNPLGGTNKSTQLSKNLSYRTESNLWRSSRVHNALQYPGTMVINHSFLNPRVVSQYDCYTCSLNIRAHAHDQG